MRSYNSCSQNSLEFKQITNLSDLLKIISEKNRLQLLCILKNNEHCVCEIMAHFQMSQSLVSHHLSDLKKISLVRSRKSSQKVYYSLTSAGRKIMQLLNEIKIERQVQK